MSNEQMISVTTSIESVYINPVTTTYLYRAVLQPSIESVSYLPGRKFVIVVEDQHLLQIVLDRLAPLALLSVLIVIESSNTCINIFIHIQF